MKQNGKKRIKLPPAFKESEALERELREIVERECRDARGRLIKRKGHFPTRQALSLLGRQDLIKAITERRGGFAAVREALGFPPGRRPHRYWADFKNVETELREIIGQEYRDEEGRVIKESGVFPIRSMLSAIGKSSLAAAMNKYFGGILAVRAAMGFDLHKHPTGYWKDFKNVEMELRRIIEMEVRNSAGKIIKPTGSFPTEPILRELAPLGLSSAISTHHGGMAAVAAKMGLEPHRHRRGYWSDPETIKRGLQAIVEKEYRDESDNLIKQAGDFPTIRVLSRLGRDDLANAIMRHLGGVVAAREALGFARIRRPRGYWKDFENLQRELREIIDRQYRDESGKLIKKHGEFPTYSMLDKMGHRSMQAAMRNYHGGMVAVRHRMGFAPVTRPNKYWKDFGNLKRELLEVIENEYCDAQGRQIKSAGEFPTTVQLQRLGRKSISHAIVKYHGGLRHIRSAMGFETPFRPAGYWKDFNNVKRELEQAIQQEIKNSAGEVIKKAGVFPTGSLLRAHGYGSLLNALEKYCGGLTTVRQRLGFPPTLRPRNPWRDFANVEQKLREVMKEEYRDQAGRVLRPSGIFPGEKELREKGLSGLLAALSKYHGGAAAVRARMGIAPSKGEREYWKDFGNVERDLIEIIENEYRDEHGNVVKAKDTYPTYGELQRIDRSDLIRAMQVYHGGYRAVKARMGYSDNVPRETVDIFLKKLDSIEGAEELVRCPDLTIADKADILISCHRNVFVSMEYLDWVLKTLMDLPSFAPYMETGHSSRGAYKTSWGLDVLVERHPDLFSGSDLFDLLVRKMENVCFHRFQEDPQHTLGELKKRKEEEGMLAEVYGRVDENLRKMQFLRIPTAAKRIRNPNWRPGSGLERTVPFPSLHQKRGILRIVEQRRILIADEMGTGKTAQAILAKLLLEERLGRRVRTLVVCPSSVVAWWREKIDEYCEDIRAEDVVVLSSGGWQSGAMERARAGTDFVLINYDLLSRKRRAGYPSLVGELADLGFDYVVVDEVHNAKNMNTNRAEAIQRITEHVQYAALLSGTPIPNRLCDIGMTMSLLEPERYPTAKHFTRAYGNNPRLIRDALISGRMLRVRSQDVSELPDLRFREVSVKLKPEQRDAYLAIYRDGGLNAYAKMALLRLMLLDPNTVPRYIPSVPIPSPKYEALDGILADKVGEGGKVVVFTCFKQGITMKLVERYKKLGACVIDGDVAASPKKTQESRRERIRKEFQYGDKRVLIATIGTMSEGVDLSAATTVVFLDKPFTSTARDQAIKRVHRLGQTRPVEVVSLVARDPVIDEVIRDRETGDHGTLDEAIERLIVKKEMLIEQVVDGARLSDKERELLQDEESLGRVLLRIA